MPPSMHKVLIHGADIIKSLNVPIGQLSEEAQEARNKDFKRYRENNSRTSSRIHTNEDIFHFLLISSDPIITKLRHDVKTDREPLHPEARDLLKNLNYSNIEKY